MHNFRFRGLKTLCIGGENLVVVKHFLYRGGQVAGHSLRIMYITFNSPARVVQGGSVEGLRDFNRLLAPPSGHAHNIPYCWNKIQINLATWEAAQPTMQGLLI
jgi:hypothetical protein